MFDNEIFMAIVREIPGVLDIVLRYWYELATHVLGLISNAL